MIAPTLKGDLAILKPMEPKHAEIIYKWYSDPKVAKYQDFHFSSEKGIRGRIVKRKKSANDVSWMISTTDSKLIGEIKLREINHGNKKAKLGINIGETTFWNQGYATDAIRIVSKYFFNKLKYNRIELTVDIKNFGGIKCYEKCGFVKEATIRCNHYKNKKYHDSYLMSLIKKDYKKLI